jgi:hypothetical protein
MEIIYNDDGENFVLARLEPPPVIGPPTEAWYNRRILVEQAAARISMLRSDEQRAKSKATRASAGKRPDKSGNSA